MVIVLSCGIWQGGGVVVPAADVEITEDLVVRLIDEQCPEFRGPVRHESSGFDNVLFRVGADYMARLPRHVTGDTLMRHELRWLPELAGTMSLPVSAPLVAGRPSRDYPYAWSLVRRFEGTAADLADIIDHDAVATKLAFFLRSLHHPSPSDAPKSPVRGVPLTDRHEAFAHRIAAVEPRDAQLLTRVFEAALAAATYEGPPLWMHGDLHPGNVIIAGGDLVGVVDFGDLNGGDPAGDLVAAWMLFDETSRALFFSLYQPPADMVRRAAGWAALFAVFFIEISLETRPTYGRVARHTMTQLALDAGWLEDSARGLHP